MNQRRHPKLKSRLGGPRKLERCYIRQVYVAWSGGNICKYTSNVLKKDIGKGQVMLVLWLIHRATPPLASKIRSVNNGPGGGRNLLTMRMSMQGPSFGVRRLIGLGYRGDASNTNGTAKVA